MDIGKPPDHAEFLAKHGGILGASEALGDRWVAFVKRHKDDPAPLPLSMFVAVVSTLLKRLKLDDATHAQTEKRLAALEAKAGIETPKLRAVK